MRSIVYPEAKSEHLSSTDLANLAEELGLDHLICPISFQVMSIPVITQTGKMYDWKSLVNHRNKCAKDNNQPEIKYNEKSIDLDFSDFFIIRDPLDNTPLTQNPVIVYAIRAQIEEFIKNAPALKAKKLKQDRDQKRLAELEQLVPELEGRIQQLEKQNQMLLSGRRKGQEFETKTQNRQNLLDDIYAENPNETKTDSKFETKNNSPQEIRSAAPAMNFPLSQTNQNLFTANSELKEGKTDRRAFNAPHLPIFQQQPFSFKELQEKKNLNDQEVVQLFMAMAYGRDRMGGDRSRTTLATLVCATRLYANSDPKIKKWIACFSIFCDFSYQEEEKLKTLKSLADEEFLPAQIDYTQYKLDAISSRNKKYIDHDTYLIITKAAQTGDPIANYLLGVVIASDFCLDVNLNTSEKETLKLRCFLNATLGKVTDAVSYLKACVGNINDFDALKVFNACNKFLNCFKIHSYDIYANLAWRELFEVLNNTMHFLVPNVAPAGGVSQITSTSSSSSSSVPTCN